MRATGTLQCFHFLNITSSLPGRAMTFDAALQNLGGYAVVLAAEANTELDPLFTRLTRIRGTFPTSLALLERLGDPDILAFTTLPDLILHDPILTLRLLSLVNMAHYNPGKEMLTLEHACAHLGMMTISERVQDLAAIKNWNAVLLGRSTAAVALQEMLVSGILARQLVTDHSTEEGLGELACIASYLVNIPRLALAYFRPNIYSAIAIDEGQDRGGFEQSWAASFGKGLGACAAKVGEDLKLPGWYVDVAYMIDREIDALSAQTTEEKVALSVNLANKIASIICNFEGIQGLQSVLRELERNSGIDIEVLEDAVGKVLPDYLSACEALGLTALRLPEYLSSFRSGTQKDVSVNWPLLTNRINPFMYELRACFKTEAVEGEFYRLPQALHCAVHALMKGLNFDRVVFLQADEAGKSLTVRYSVGVKLFNPDGVQRFVHDPDASTMPDVKAFRAGEPVFNGDPLFEDGWPFAAFPVIWNRKKIGVLYADRTRRPDSTPLNTQEQVAIIAVAQEWQNISELFH